MLAADVTELGMIAVHLPFDQRSAPATQRRVMALQAQLASVLPLASAAANRLDLLRGAGPLPADLSDLLDDVTAWLARDGGSPGQAGALIRRCTAMAHAAEARTDWESLLMASACIRIADFVTGLAAGQRLANRSAPRPPGHRQGAERRFCTGP
jgi:hypothetical protein